MVHEGRLLSFQGFGVSGKAGYCIHMVVHLGLSRLVNVADCVSNLMSLQEIVAQLCFPER